MMRPLILATALVLFAFTAAATPVAADDTCTPGTDDHPAQVCIPTQQCSALGFCVDPTHPTGTAKDLVNWAKEQLGPCTCDPQPDPGP